MRFLELAGSRLKGPNWTNIRDRSGGRGYIAHDLRVLPIPNLEDESFDGVYSEHFIEHLTKEEGINIFKEMLRVMKFGATIRTIWPSMDLVDRLKSNPNPTDCQFADMYNQYIISRENCFRNPYYRQFGDISYFNSMTNSQRAAFRLIHQEGEHKHLWYKQELIDCLKDLGFKDVREEQYRHSRIPEFSNLETTDLMRTLHSTVVEATK